MQECSAIETKSRDRPASDGLIRGTDALAKLCEPRTQKLRELADATVLRLTLRKDLPPRSMALIF